MTRRVRFTPFLRAGCFVLAAAGAARPTAGDQVAYGFPLTAASLPGATVGAIEVADLDRDTDPDLYATVPSENRVIALRNTTGTGSSLQLVNVATGLAGVRGLAAADFNGDYAGDAASASPGAGTVMVHQHLGATSWVQRTLSTNLPGATAVAAADLDRDGDQDVLAGSTAGVLVWFSNDGGTAASWTARTVATGLGSLTSVAVADLDGDGDPDLLTVSPGGPVWYENTGGAATFVPHTAGLSPSPTSVAAADIDGDGDADVVSWGASAGVVWHENAGSLWATHTITGPVAVLAARLADLDADGDVDVWTAQDPSGAGVYYDNLGGGKGWTPRTPVGEPNPTAVATVDLDRDGDLDVLSASQVNGGQIRRIVNATTHRNACFRPEVPIFTSTDKPDAILSGDVDGDGDLDLVSTHNVLELTMWHENPGASGPWTPHTISTMLLRNGRLDVGDIDGDGDLDVVGDFGGSASASLGAQWLENVSPTAPFVPHFIGTTGIYDGVSHAVDVDGDGDLDAMLIANLGYGSFSRWFANPGNGSSPWPMTSLAGDQGVPADVDRDGDVDMFGWIQFFADFFWLDNVAGDGSVWQRRTIAAGTLGGTTFAGDVDRDGDVEPFVAGPTGYYRNDAGGLSWTFATLPGPLGRLRMADLDVDGDPDLPGTGSFVHGWLKNLNGAGTSWEFNLIPATHGGTGSSQMIVADIDGDSDPDLAAAPANDLVWIRNAGGQLAVAVDSQAPATAQQGTRVWMLRAVVTHLGLPGESNVEPTRVRVLLEEAPGDPLTTAEANAVIAELEIYRDQNQNGVYDPGDLLLEQSAILTLVNGVHEISFPTSSKHEIAVGDPATLFVVMHLTNDASTQQPNRFQVTLLTDGALASAFRNVTWGAPIRLACPVNVPSGVTVVTIPVELMGFTIE